MAASLLYGKSLISIRDLTRPQIEQVLTLAATLDHKGDYSHILPRKIAYIGTDEPSSRTVGSFWAAASRLGMLPYPVSDAARISSFAKGESLYDGIRMLTKYADIVAFRHQQPGSMRTMRKAIEDEPRMSNRIPLISAGEADSEHPTQALLDALTIRQSLGRLSEFNIVLAGDCRHSRTIRSLVYLLGLYDNIHIHFVSPPQLRIKDDLAEFLSMPEVTRRTISYIESGSLENALPDADVLYMTRAQKERHEGSTTDDVYLKLTDILAKKMPYKSIIMHPLPRNSEVDVLVDTHPGAVYLNEQPENGVRIRMALFMLMLLEEVPSDFAI